MRPSSRSTSGGNDTSFLSGSSTNYTTFCADMNKYRARLPRSAAGGKLKWIGYFSTKEEAENAVAAALAKRLASSSSLAAAASSSEPVDAPEPVAVDHRCTEEECVQLIKVWWGSCTDHMVMWGNVYVTNSVMKRAGLCMPLSLRSRCSTVCVAALCRGLYVGRVCPYVYSSTGSQVLLRTAILSSSSGRSFMNSSPGRATAPWSALMRVQRNRSHGRPFYDFGKLHLKASAKIIIRRNAKVQDFPKCLIGFGVV